MKRNVTRALVGLAVVGSFAAASAPAAAACTTAYVCTWDNDYDGTVDTASAGTASAGMATVVAQNGYDKVLLQGPFATAQATGWYVDENGDGDFERVYLGGSGAAGPGTQKAGAYATVYMVDRDQGDVVDYLSAVAQGGTGGLVVGGGIEYRDERVDLQPATPYTSLSAL